MGLLCKILEQVNSFLSKRESHCKVEMLTLEAPFVEEISGMAITKMLDARDQKTLTMKLKFIRNRAIFKVMNSTHKAVTFDPKEILGIIDLWSLGYYKINKGVLQQKPQLHVSL